MPIRAQIVISIATGPAHYASHRKLVAQDPGRQEDRRGPGPPHQLGQRFPDPTVPHAPGQRLASQARPVPHLI